MSKGHEARTSPQLGGPGVDDEHGDGVGHYAKQILNLDAAHCGPHTHTHIDARARVRASPHGPHVSACKRGSCRARQISAF